MDLSNKKYYQEDLNTDADGKKWQLMFSSIIDKSNFMEFEADKAFTKEDVEIKINEAHDFVKDLGFSDNLIEIYATNFQFQKQYNFYSIIARLSIDSKVKDKVSSFKTLLEFVLKGDEDNDMFNPAFYYNNTALLWTISDMSCANILLAENERDLLIKKGFLLYIDNGNQPPVRRD